MDATGDGILSDMARDKHLGSASVVHELQRSLRDRGRVTLQKAFWLPLLMAVGLLLLVPVFVMMSREPDIMTRGIAWFSLVVCPLTALMILSVVVDRSPVLVDEDGIHVPGLYGWRLAWKDVVAVGVWGPPNRPSQQRVDVAAAVGSAQRAVTHPRLARLLARRGGQSEVAYLFVPRLEHAPALVAEFLSLELERRQH